MIQFWCIKDNPLSSCHRRLLTMYGSMGAVGAWGTVEAGVSGPRTWGPLVKGPPHGHGATTRSWVACPLQRSPPRTRPMAHPHAADPSAPCSLSRWCHTISYMSCSA